MVSPANVRIYILERLIFINDLKKLLRGKFTDTHTTISRTTFIHDSVGTAVSMWLSIVYTNDLSTHTAMMYYTISR